MPPKPIGSVCVTRGGMCSVATGASVCTTIPSSSTACRTRTAARRKLSSDVTCTAAHEALACVRLSRSGACTAATSSACGLSAPSGCVSPLAQKMPSVGVPSGPKSPPTAHIGRPEAVDDAMP
eukprot:5215203-Prymnesium_polylepis.4